jgi:hypothetical protein
VFRAILDSLIGFGAAQRDKTTRFGRIHKIDMKAGCAGSSFCRPAGAAPNGPLPKRRERPAAATEGGLSRQGASPPGSDPGPGRPLKAWAAAWGLWMAMVGALPPLAGCGTPSGRVFAAAAEFGFQPLALEGGRFRLEGFFKPAQARERETLHVYLEGDGTPWETRWRIADDPTPRDPVMLRLMALDPGPALYLGRPCYYGHARDPGCSPELWTGRRYGPEVVGGMEAGLRGFLGRHGYRRLALLGHSGGGALALLLAPRFPETRIVATLAGNLDTDAWVAYHGYAPLSGSFNPAAVNSGDIEEYHYLGAEDRVIPAKVFGPIARRRSPARTVILPKFDHTCCWGDIWETILNGLADGPRRTAGPVSAPRPLP